MKIIRQNLVFLLPYFFIGVITIQSAPGDLDATFGNGGKVIYRFNDREDSFQAVGASPDNKIVVAGKRGDGQTFVFRYNPNGTLDESFANGGMLLLPPLSGAVFEGIALQTDGKIVVAGAVNLSGNNYAILLLRINPNGTMDTTFDGDGVVSTNLTEKADIAYDVALQTDGKIVVSIVSDGSGDNFGSAGVVRYNPNGSLDTSFDGDGVVITSIPEYVGRGYALKIQTDGKIVVSASSNALDLSQRFLAVIRYLPDGALDSSFGTNGISLTNLNGNLLQFGDLGILSDGRILVLGSIGVNTTFAYDFTVFRFLPNGSLDTSFGTNGKTVIYGGDTNSAQSLAVGQGGKIYAVGHANIPGNGLDILTARLNQDGSFDAGFGTNGRIYTQVGTPPRSDYAWDAVLQPDGKLVVVGDFSLSLFDYDAVVLRFLGDSATQRSKPFDYDGDGKADVSVFRPADRTWFLNQSTGGFYATQFGLSTDKIVPADYDGDGKTDIAVYRGGTWYLQRSQAGFAQIQFGTADDIPVPADYTGDGKAEIAVYRHGTWWAFNLADNQTSIAQFGNATDKPVAADYDGDGKADQSVYRNGEWHLNQSTFGYSVVNFGLPTDKPVVADYDGDGRSDQAVYRNGIWYVLQSTNGFSAIQWGLAEDVPAPADYDGDGNSDLAVFRNGMWFLSQSANGISTQQFGLFNDLPTQSAFIP